MQFTGAAESGVELVRRVDKGLGDAFGDAVLGRIIKQHEKNLGNYEKRIKGFEMVLITPKKYSQSTEKPMKFLIEK